MRNHLKYSLLLSVITLAGCATGPSNAELRKSHFKAEPQKEARLQDVLNAREQAVCSTDNSITDRNAKPLVRIPPVMPPAANTSGACDLTFDVNAMGQIVNIKTVICTDDIFNMSSRKSLSRWKYNPKVSNGKAVAQCGLETKIAYILVDNSGKKIEPK